ncbi:MAG: hypothetical protein GY953_41050 [bacterium]|nr:hypothetical protein [bacterium]
MYEALASGTQRRELPVSVASYWFPGSAGRPVLVLSVGTEVRALESRQVKGKEQFSVSVLAGVADTGYRRPPVFREDQLRYSPEPDTQPPGAPRGLLTHNTQFPLAAGDHWIELAVRDDHSGKMGMVEIDVTAPDFRAESTPSSLLLTTQAIPATEDAGEPDTNNPIVLEAGNSRFVPHPAPIVRQGDKLHLFYMLANATPEDFSAVEEGVLFEILRDGRLVPDIEGSALTVRQRDSGLIRFTATFETGNLNPGRHEVVAVLPNPEDRDEPDVATELNVVE